MGIGGHHHLLAGCIDGVEGVEEFFLGGAFVGEEVHVVDDKDIETTEALMKCVALTILNRVDKLVGEIFTRDVLPAKARMTLLQFVADTLEQMRLAQSAAAMDEQRIELRAGCFSHRFGTAGRRPTCQGLPHLRDGYHVGLNGVEAQLSQRHLSLNRAAFVSQVYFDVGSRIGDDKLETASIVSASATLHA